MIPNDAHGNPPLGGEHSAVNRIFVQQHGGGTGMSPQAVYTHSGNSRSALYIRCTIKNDAHGNPPLFGEYSAVNGIFVHPLYGAVQLNGGGPCTSHTGSVHILGSPVAPCTLGVRLRIPLMAMHHWAVKTLPPTKLLYTRCLEL